MWPLAECISSLLVRTPSLQLGVLQSLPSSFQLIRSHSLIPLIHTSGGIQGEAVTSLPSIKAAHVRHKGVNPFTSSQRETMPPTRHKCATRGDALQVNGTVGITRVNQHLPCHVLPTLLVTLPVAHLTQLQMTNSGLFSNSITTSA